VQGLLVVVAAEVVVVLPPQPLAEFMVAAQALTTIQTPVWLVLLAVFVLFMVAQVKLILTPLRLRNK
jgi:hypothetical protein